MLFQTHFFPHTHDARLNIEADLLYTVQVDGDLWTMLMSVF